MAQNLKAAAKKLKKKGRFGDSELVHVNPAEKKMLENMSGGIVTKNPDTGLDEHFWSILVPAAIGAITGASRGGGLKGALKGALLGGATAGLGAGIGGMVNGNGFMSGLGSMFGGEGTGLSGLGSMFGGGDAAKSASSLVDSTHYSNPIGPVASLGSGAKNIAAATAANAPVGAAEQSMGGIGKFLSTPQGLTIAASALGMLTGKDKDPYAADRAKKEAEDRNYPRYDGGSRNYNFAEGGAVDQNNPTPINFQSLSAYTVPTPGIGAADFGKEIYTPRPVRPEELAGKSAAASKPLAKSWISPNGAIITESGLANNYAMEQNVANNFHTGQHGLAQASSYAGWTPAQWMAAGYSQYAKGGDVHTESDMTRPLRPDIGAEKKISDAARKIEKQMGRSLNEEEMQDLIDRMGGGIGQMQPAYAAGGPVAGIGGGKEDKIPAMLSDGEHVITADEVSMLGDGSNNAGHKKLYAMRKKLRKHKTGRTKQMPMAKSPEAYAGIGA